ncbi:MAG: diol dehydratase small subunit [Acidimicrobiales bacterium]
MTAEPTRAERVTLDAVRAGSLGPADVRIDPATLVRQAAVAEAGGNPQLGANLRRAAEMATLDDDEVLAVYEVLRPLRSTAAELIGIGGDLRRRGLPRCAALVEEAARVHERRGLCR